MSDDVNNQLVLIGGESGTGKSTALRNIKNPDRWLYLNCEAGKRLPFRSKFIETRISDPYQVHEAFDECTLEDGELFGEVDGIIVDSITFLMDMFESTYVRNSANSQKAWGDYADFFKTLLQNKIVLFGKPVILIAHVRMDMEESGIGTKTAVPIKGSLKNNGVEAYFSTVVSAKKLQLKELKEFSSDLLNITEEERELGYKHVFQTRITKGTTGERIRGPMDLFTKAQTFMDNDAQLLLDHLHAYYA